MERNAKVVDSNPTSVKFLNIISIILFIIITINLSQLNGRLCLAIIVPKSPQFESLTRSTLHHYPFIIKHSQYPTEKNECGEYACNLWL